MAEQGILVAGAGKIGSLISTFLSETNDYHVHLADINTQLFDSIQGIKRDIKKITLDINDKLQLKSYLDENDIHAIISCLPYYCNVPLARCAKECQVHYFDLTEDVDVFNEIKALAQDAKCAFVPQCGVAPGFVNIVAADLMTRFSEVKEVLLRVGAIPLYPHNVLKYALNWSTEGLINEYANPCYGIVNFEQVFLQPLADLETIIIDGVVYEAFNTSGGVGNLVESFKGKVETLNYKTLRYPGHCEKMRLLFRDFKLNKHRENLKDILENSLPRTNQDVVIIYVAVNGIQDEAVLIEQTFVKKIVGESLCKKSWSAIQIATAASACTVVDLVLQKAEKPHGLVLQESIAFADFINNRFARFFV